MCELKIYRGVMCHDMTMKNDAKLDEKLTRQFKIEMRNLRNFDQSTGKSQKFAKKVHWLLAKKS